MAVYTILSDDDVEIIRQAFDLSPIIAFKGIAEGVQNSNYFLETEESRYILTIYEAMTDVKELPFFLGATEFAAKNSIPAALPIHTKNGDLTFNLNGKTLALCSFLKGVSPKTPNVAQVRSAGIALANLHLAMQNYPNKRVNDLGPIAWQNMWNIISDKAGGFEIDLKSHIENDLLEIAQNWPHDLPKGFIHADLFPDNVLYIGDKVSGLIDFYFAANDYFAYDLAIMLNAWCFLPLGREFDLTKGRALLAGYESVRPLTPSEKNAMPLLARGAALRFFLTRMADWLKPNDGAMVTKKDPREYSARLAFHRNAKSMFDYGSM
jgi:homoserine kinase type II